MGSHPHCNCQRRRRHRFPVSVSASSRASYNQRARCPHRTWADTWAWCEALSPSCLLERCRWRGQRLQTCAAPQFCPNGVTDSFTNVRCVVCLNGAPGAVGHSFSHVPIMERDKQHKMEMSAEWLGVHLRRGTARPNARGQVESALKQDREDRNESRKSSQVVKSMLYFCNAFAGQVRRSSVPPSFFPGKGC